MLKSAIFINVKTFLILPKILIKYVSLLEGHSTETCNKYALK